MVFNLIGVLILTYLNLPALKKLFRRIKRKSWLILLAIVLMGLIVRVAFGPWAHIVYFDEYDYMQSAKWLVAEGRFGLCITGSLEACQKFILFPQQIGVSFLFSAVFFMAEASSSSLMFLNLLINLASIALVFCMGYLMLKRENSALFAAFVFSLVPIYVSYSTSAAPDIISVFLTFSALTMLFAYLESRSFRSLLLFSLVLAYALQTRTENQMLILLAILLFLMYGCVRVLWRKRSLMILLVLLAAEFFAMMYVGNVLVNKEWIHRGPLSLSYIPKNSYYIYSWLSNVPFIFAIFTIIGIIMMIRSRKRFGRQGVFLGAWLLLYALVFMVYPYFKAERFTISVFPPLVILSGAGFGIMSFFRQDRLRKAAVFLLISISLLCFLSFIPKITLPDPVLGDFWQETEFMRSLSLENGLIVAAHPGFVNFETGMSVIYIKDIEYIADKVNGGERVYFYHDLWCNDPIVGAYCKGIDKNFEMGLVEEREIRDNKIDNNKRVAIYELVKVK